MQTKNFTKLLGLRILIIFGLFNPALISAQNSYTSALEKNEMDIASKYSIYRKIEYKVGLDTSGNSLWERIENIKEFDNNGKLILIIYPIYKAIDLDMSNINVFSELKLISSSMVETNI